MKNRNRKTIILVIGLILIAKYILSKYINSPILKFEESCIAQKAIDFINNSAINNCTHYSELENSSQMPLFSILISPFYGFFGITTAYKIVTAINTLLATLLIIPAYKICNKLINNRNLSLLISSIIPFLPQILIFENTITPEIFSISLMLWGIYAYWISLENNKKWKPYALVIAVLAAISSPLGFILLTAITINEIIFNKNKKNIALFNIPLFLTTIIIATLLSDTNTPELIRVTIENINDVFMYKGILFGQPIFLTLIACASSITAISALYNAKKSNEIREIKPFILSMIFLSIFATFIRTLSYITNLESIPHNLFTAQNLNTISIVSILFTLTLFKEYKNRRLIIIGIITIILSSYYSVNLANKITTEDNYFAKISEYFMEKEENIVFLEEEDANNLSINPSFWRLKTLTKNKTSWLTLSKPNADNISKEITRDTLLYLLDNKFSYIISSLKLPLENIFTVKESTNKSQISIYKVPPK